MKEISKYLSIDRGKYGLEIYIGGECRFFKELGSEPFFYKYFPPSKSHYDILKLWSDHNYDYELLDIRISIPLLKCLREIGDPVALIMFKKEVLRFLQDPKLLKTNILYSILSLKDSEIEFILENLFSQKGFFSTLKNFDMEEQDYYFGCLQIEKYFQKYAPTCPSEILVDIMYCLTRIYVTGSFSDTNWMVTHRIYNGYKVLTSLFTDILSNHQFFEKVVGVYKILIEKKDWKFFYNIGYLFFESSKNMSPELKNNIKEYLLHEDEKDIEAIVKSRWLEHFEPADLEELFFGSQLGALEKLSICKYWVSNKKTRVWHFSDETDDYVLHSNLAFPVFKKLFDSENKAIKDVIAREIQNIFKSDDISGILYLVQEDFMQIARNQMNNLISDLSLDNCKKLLKELYYNRAYYEMEGEISLNLFSVKKFKKKVKKLYETERNFLSDEEWEVFLDCMK